MVSHPKYVGVLGAVIPAQADHRHSRAGGSPSFPRMREPRGPGTMDPRESGDDEG